MGPSSLLKAQGSSGRRTGLITALLGSVAFFLFGLVDAAQLLHHDGGLAGQDFLRIGASAFVLGFIPCGLLGLLAAAVDRLTGSSWRRRLFWPLPLTGSLLLAIGAFLWVPQMRLLGALALLAVVMVALLLRLRPALVAPPLFTVPFVWGMALAAGLFIPLQYADARWTLNGLPRLLLTAPLISALALGVGWGNMLLDRWRDTWPRAVTSGAVTIGGGGLAIGFWMLVTERGDYLFFKMFVLYVIVFALIGTAGSRLIGRLARSTRVCTVAAALGLVGCVCLLWLPLQSIPRRFGRLSVDSLSGLVVYLVSITQDHDNDGYYPVNLGGNDCEDLDPGRHPVSDRPCRRSESRRLAPARTDVAARPVRHVLVLLVDSLRADEVNDAEKRKRYPFLARAVQRAARFSRAYAPGNTTRLSVAPMLTGRSPLHWLPRAGTDQTPRDPGAWIFARTGWRLTPHFLLFSEFAWMQVSGQIFDKRGITEWHPPVEGRTYPATRLVDRVIRLFDERDRDERLLIVGFTTDSHRPYRCRDGKTGGTRCYRQAIGIVDEQLGRLFAALRRRRLLAETLIVLSADHGEELGDHGHHGEHGTSLYEEQIHVPLLLWHPNLPASVIDLPVSLMGLVTTISDATNQPLPAGDPAGVYPSWLALAFGKRTSMPPVVVHHWTDFFVQLPVRQSALIEGSLKLVYDWRTNTSRLFRLDRDPCEQLDLARREPATTDRLRELLWRETVRQ